MNDKIEYNFENFETHYCRIDDNKCRDENGQIIYTIEDHLQ